MSDILLTGGEISTAVDREFRDALIRRKGIGEVFVTIEVAVEIANSIGPSEEAIFITLVGEIGIERKFIRVPPAGESVGVGKVDISHKWQTDYSVVVNCITTR
jgi:hypothetical protein